MLHGDASVIVNGKFAQFGGRMMVQVSEMILVQFVENFRQAALALPAPASTASSPAAAASASSESAAAPRSAPPRTAAPARAAPRTSARA